VQPSKPAMQKYAEIAKQALLGVKDWWMPYLTIPLPQSLGKQCRGSPDYRANVLVTVDRSAKPTALKPRHVRIVFTCNNELRLKTVENCPVAEASNGWRKWLS